MYVKLTYLTVHLKLTQHCRSTAAAAAIKSLQSCPTLCDPTDGSPPGSPIPGILQARTLEWVAISFSYILVKKKKRKLPFHKKKKKNLRVLVLELKISQVAQW